MLCVVIFVEVFVIFDLLGGVVNIFIGLEKELVVVFVLYMDINVMVYVGNDKEFYCEM